MRYCVIALCLLGAWTFVSRFTPGLIHAAGLPVLLVVAVGLTIAIGNKVR